ncbi:MAG: right-handed parallel beta-helix repeat-containing protein [Myxococcales bacterium]|nr:right-handed parallel beta-helix repeat-containing protein [Myxococcales bacterium]
MHRLSFVRYPLFFLFVLSCVWTFSCDGSVAPKAESAQEQQPQTETTTESTAESTTPDAERAPESNESTSPEPTTPETPNEPSSEPTQPEAGPGEMTLPESSPEPTTPEATVEASPEPTPEQPPTTATCAPLPAAQGTIVQVKPSQAAQLPQIVAQAKSDTTILLADGTYKMQGSESQRRINFRQPRVTLRSASGDPTKVIIDGEYNTQEMIFIGADDVTIAEITLRRAKYHHIHITGKSGGGHTQRTKLYRLRLLDGGQQFVKVNSANNQTDWSDDGRLECSHLEMTSQGRPNIESRFGGCYTGGIDAHGAWKWQVRFNTFIGIYCTNGSLAEHAIHFWRAGRDTLVERNTIIDCARGIGFGLGKDPSTSDRKYPDDPYPAIPAKGHIDGIIRNNLIHTSATAQPYYDTGIELEQAHGVLVVHNTAVSKATFTGLSYRFQYTKATIRNNLLYKLSPRDNAQATADHNMVSVPASYFVNPTKVDYHLTSSATNAIDKGVVVPQAGLDLDGNPRNNGTPDLGAYESNP